LRMYGNEDRYLNGEQWSYYPPLGASEFHVRPFAKLNEMTYSFAVKAGRVPPDVKESPRAEESDETHDEEKSHYLNCQECMEAMADVAGSGSPSDMSPISIEVVSDMAQIMTAGCKWEEKKIVWMTDESVDSFLTDVMLAIEGVFIKYALQKSNHRYRLPTQESEVNTSQSDTYITPVSKHRNNPTNQSDTPETVVLSPTEAQPDSRVIPEQSTEFEDEIEEVESEGEEVSETAEEVKGEENTNLGRERHEQGTSQASEEDPDRLPTAPERSENEITPGREGDTYVFMHEQIIRGTHVYQDSGATRYICRDKSLMSNMTSVKLVKFRTGNGERKIDQAGDMQVCRIDGKGRKHTLVKHAYYDPIMPINIIPTGNLDHFHHRSIVHQNGQLFILKDPIPIPQGKVMVRGRLTKSLLYRWDTEQDKSLDIHTRYVPKGAPTQEPVLGHRGRETPIEECE